MKTYEFINKVENLGFCASMTSDGDIIISNRTNEEYLSLLNEQYYIDTNFQAYYKLKDDVKQKLFNLAVEYASTPIEEREEEKGTLMIQVGDKYHYQNEDWEVVNVSYPTRLERDKYYFVIENEGINMRIPLALFYQEMCEQQKLRADRAEKRWSELKDFLNESAMLADEKFQKVNNAALLSEAITCERIVEKMKDLEEDGE